MVRIDLETFLVQLLNNNSADDNYWEDGIEDESRLRIMKLLLACLFVAYKLLIC